MATQVRARDAMQFIDEQDPATLARLVERLEYRATDPTFTAYRDAYLALIDLPSAGAVLDVGCGTGVVARAIAAREGFAGTVTGIDQSPEFLAAAERLAAADGVGDRVEFVLGDAHDAEPPRGELRRRRGTHAGQSRPRPAGGPRRGGPRDAAGRMGGDLRRRLRLADLRELRPGAAARRWRPRSSRSS